MTAFDPTTPSSGHGPAATLRRIAGRAIDWVSRRPWLALPPLALPAIWPFYSLGLPASSDGMLHLLRLVLLNHQIQQGIFYPRWVPELALGLGYPLWNFYSPSTYYLAQLFHFLGMDFFLALKAAFATIILAAGAGMYLLARDIFGPQGRWPALAAAAAYMYAPYLLTNVFIRGAIAEAGAGALLPLILWSTRRLILEENPRPYVLALAFSLGGMAVTHNITLLLAPPALLGYAAVVWWRAGRPRSRLPWLAGGAVAAMGVSAFFWLPLIGERGYLAKTAYHQAANFLPENVWTWGNFLDLHLAFEHTFHIPFQLGLAQVVLALLGLLLARRRDAEWLYLLAVALIGCVGISAAALPLWLSSDILLVAQFPWRLLTLVTLPLALFAGGVLLWLRRPTHQALVSIPLLALILLAHSPRLEWMETISPVRDLRTFRAEHAHIGVSAVPQYEMLSHALGLGSADEFRPLWSDGALYRPAGEPRDDDLSVELHRASPLEISLTVTSSAGGPLRMMNYYYPGWRAVLGDGSQLRPYPTTNLGLLTVDVPPGAHELRLIWNGTPLQRGASAISLLALAGTVLFYVLRRRWLPLALLPALVLLLACLAFVYRPPAPEIATPSQPLRHNGLEMLGYRLENSHTRYLNLYPYWYVRDTPAKGLSLHWQVRDAAGELISQSLSRPMFNSYDAANWPPATLVDDAYQIILPPTLPAGAYQLNAQFVNADGEPASALTPVGILSLPAIAYPEHEPHHRLDVRFDDEVRLAGYDLLVNGRRPISTRPPILHPGDSLDIVLFWQALGFVSANLHGFVHLVDLSGDPFVQRDHTAGSMVRPSLLWDPDYLQPDEYRLRLPRDAESKLYWPMVGLYRFETVELLAVTDAAGAPLGDVYRLPPVKVLARSDVASPQVRKAARFGELADLIGYDLHTPQERISPGDTLVLTLYFRSLDHTDQNYIRFVHLVHPERGMAAQMDCPPQDGENPTWTWSPAEVIVDRVVLRVDPQAPAGAYQLLIGLYEEGNSARLPVIDAAGSPLPGGMVPLTELTLVR